MELKVQSFNANTTEDDSTHIFVDGSYNKETGEYAYGMVVLLDDEDHEEYSEKFNDKELQSMWNVAGEIMGACAAMQYALDKGLPSITIHHDYEGIAKWPLGEWKAKKEGTQAYVDFYRKASSSVKIKFVHVKGHSGDKYNNLADKLARKALGL